MSAADDGSIFEPSAQPIAVTGATGYVGGRLVPFLLQRGYQVRCLVREPKKLDQRPWRNVEGVEVVQCDLKDQAKLTEQLNGCSAAYYLVHSMISAGEEYAKADQELATKFARACESAHVERIIYLGGLGEVNEQLSEHLNSRRNVETALASTNVPLTTLRAAMIVGSGSGSFEILRYLVNRLPIMVTPKWVCTECQPVAIIDVLHWLAESLQEPKTIGKTLEIGGADIHSYNELMQITAKELGLRKRIIITVPFLTPRLSSAWISLVTPVTYRLARPLAAGLSNRVIVGDKSVQAYMPHEALSSREAIQRAINVTDLDRVPTIWSAAGVMPGDPDWAGGKVYVDERSIEIDADAESVFRAVCRIGGGHGWYAGNALWKIRGLMDQLVGGPGLRRGRRHTEDISYGEALDFWRVVGIEKNKSLVLRAEMKLPGKAQLEFNLAPLETTQKATKLTMTARYRPKGLIGNLYWYSVLPLHNLVFGGMLRGIRDTAVSIKNGVQDED